MRTLAEVAEEKRQENWPGKPSLEVQSRFLCFACDSEFRSVWWANADTEKDVKGRFKQDERTYFRWATNSPFAAIMARSLVIDEHAFEQHMQQHKFDIERTYKPLRGPRLAWIGGLQVLPMTVPLARSTR